MTELWWFSSEKMTVGVDVVDGRITVAPPIVQKFVGQPVRNLRRWMQKQSGFKECCLGTVEEEKMTLIAGLDEGGMGCLAGPLVVAVTAFQKDRARIAGVTDSKRLTKNQLNELAPVISEEAAWCSYGFASVQTINELGMAQAWQLASMMALSEAPPFEKLIVDGIRLVDGYDQKQQALPKADVEFWQVSAASILAKVMRDNEMMELAQVYPDYGWITNVGYGTDEHRTGLLQHGPTPLHRTKYIRKILNPKPKPGKPPSRF